MSKNQVEVKKPLPCKQFWNDMVPTDGGRICLGCGKLVTDFRNASWAAIEKAHQETPIPVCGMYTKNQISNWSQINQDKSTSNTKLIAISAAVLTLTNLAPVFVNAQSAIGKDRNSSVQQPVKQKSKSKINKIVSGTIVVLQSDSTKMPLQGVNIFILQDSLNLKTKTDSVGRFEIDITSEFNKLPNAITLILSHPDYLSKSIVLNKKNLQVLDILFSQLSIEATKVPLISRGTAFYVMERTDLKTSTKKKWWQIWK